MKRQTILLMVCFCHGMGSIAQNTASIRATLWESTTESPLEGITVLLLNTQKSTYTDQKGHFLFKELPLGAYRLEIRSIAHQKRIVKVSLTGSGTQDLGLLWLDPLTDNFQQAPQILLDPQDLEEAQQGHEDHTAGFFQAAKDAFSRAAAFDFSQARYRARGYDAAYGTVAINGIEMNKLYDGRPQWSNWTGLNDALRNREFSRGLSASETLFGNIAGTTDINTRATASRPGIKLSYAASNKSYTHRVMATYASGLSKKRLAYVLSGSYSTALEGQLAGTSYEARSGLLSLEKQVTDRHSIYMTAFAVLNKRGKAAPNTQEVYRLKGFQYNPYWGYQGGRKRNARSKQLFEPVLMLGYEHTTDRLRFHTTFACQFGTISHQRLGYFKAPNPYPTYWKYLPSSYLSDPDSPDHTGAYLATQAFLDKGQLDWEALYRANSLHGSSRYYLYQDVVADISYHIRSSLSLRLSALLRVNAGGYHTQLNSENHAQMLDLLGGTGFTDLNQYASGEAQQQDLNQPNRVVGRQDKFQYHYRLNARVSKAFIQVQGQAKRLAYFVGLQAQRTGYQREGYYKNGAYPDKSLGKSQPLTFWNMAAKGGLTWKVSGRHLLALQGGYRSTPPHLKEVFANARVHNLRSPSLRSEQVIAADLRYLVRYPNFTADIRGYHTRFSGGMATSFYFAEGLFGDQSAFVNEMMTGIAKEHSGLECSVTYTPIAGLEISAVAGLGRFVYANNPSLYLQSESFPDEIRSLGPVYLANTPLSGSPQQAFSCGFSYRDPTYWWFQMTANYLKEHYLKTAPLLRTANFYLDSDGRPFIDPATGNFVSQEQVRRLLLPESLGKAFYINLVGGKSWKIKQRYLGIFISINNVLGKRFKTGGFEQSRKANFKELMTDRQRQQPLFGPKYWYGNPTSYYLMISLRI